MRIIPLLALLALTAPLAAAQTGKVIAPPPDVAAAPADATKTRSGLASKVIKPGTGKAHPGRTDLVTVHYTGWTTDGKMFDSSVARGAPASFPLDRVIAGWTEGVQLMVAGETRRLWIPEALAYQGKRDPRGMLVFDVELISFTSPPTAPPDVKAPPSDAKKTPSGLAYKVHQAGHRQTPAHGRQLGDGALQRMDDRWKNVRQLGDDRAARSPSRPWLDHLRRQPRARFCRVARNRSHVRWWRNHFSGLCGRKRRHRGENRSRTG